MLNPKIYIAGPYTKGDVVLNVRNALDVAEYVASLGAVPFVPHLTHFWHLVHPHDWEFWMKYDEHWLEACPGLIRIKGESKGADREVARAKLRSTRILCIDGLDEQDKIRIRRWLETF